MEMLKAKKFVFDTKALVTEINNLTREINDLTERRDYLTRRYNGLETAEQEWNSLPRVASSAKQTTPLIPLKLKKLKIKPAHVGNNGHVNGNVHLVDKTKEMIAAIMTEKPLMPKAIMEKLYATPNFEWPMSSQYLDLIIRKLAVSGQIKRIPEGFVKAD